MRKSYVGMCVVLVSLLTCSCGPDDLSPNQKTAICRALIGPIRYNTFDKTSQRYAAILLALDLKQRNQVGARLGCPKYSWNAR
jgi:hypothetical protein